MSDQCLQQCLSNIAPPEENPYCETLHSCYAVPTRHYRKVGLTPQQCARSMRDYETNACGEPIQNCLNECEKK